MFVATHTQPTPGTKVQLKLTIGEGVTYELQGVVRWTRTQAASCEGMPPGCGVQFVDLPEAARSAILMYQELAQVL